MVGVGSFNNRKRYYFLVWTILLEITAALLNNHFSFFGSSTKTSIRDFHSLHSALHARSSKTQTPKITPARYPKEVQIRTKSKNRRPRNYWKAASNVEKEIRELWESVNVTLESSTTPIPCESLLNYWKRHDIRAAIASHGGRELLVESWRDGVIIPGKWKEAVQNPYVQQLLQQDSNLSPEVPPLSPQQRKHTFANDTSSNTERPDRWHHSSDRKPVRYWSSMRVLLEELYQYLEERRLKERKPEGWMPRLSELEHAGRRDIALTIQRYGGARVICKKAGLVPFREWNYVEGMHELLLRLKKYLDEHNNGDYTEFPVAWHVKERGEDRLYSLIQYYGGVKFLSSRLAMDDYRTKKRKKYHGNVSGDMSWGPFDLVFAIDLYGVCREEQLKLKPPLQYPTIYIPSQLDLLKYGDKGAKLDQQINEYGGYENVARRLGLEFSVRSSKN